MQLVTTDLKTDVLGATTSPWTLR